MILFTLNTYCVSGRFCRSSFIVELFGCFQFVLADIVKMCCGFLTGQAVKKTALAKMNLLHFLNTRSDHPETKMLALESAKVFLGSSKQFVFQLYILQQTVKTNHEISQYASIIASFLLIFKTAFTLYTYEKPREIPNPDNAETLCTKIQNAVKNINKSIK